MVDDKLAPNVGPRWLRKKRGEEEKSSSTGYILWRYGTADAVAAGRRTEEPDVVKENDVAGRPTYVISKRRVQLGSVNAITTQRTISTREHLVEDETDPEMTFKTLPRTTAAVALLSSRMSATRDGINMASGRATD